MFFYNICVINKQDGTFMVRRRKDADEPYAISVVCNRQFRHVILRQRPDQLFAIGSPKDNEKVAIYNVCVTAYMRAELSAILTPVSLE